ncbi:tetratricopeptide repeat protein [Flavobacterium yafengii]|uniref:tetratricopeptide repeat protein n=1 Tax=Flavobacterium yafengii TaxID=3041253 RepID=UPI0024A7C561|nr:tetratricopeptide repeat protein [Flavobacterium yafengii]MDI5887704.1 tetratricopeptide repeat protein [Flavobacterium yafengii]
MLEQILNTFDVNTDAIATNRGFYYQYLSILKKWIQNFVENKNIVTYTEVDNDIKEVGQELIFTQIKCYSSNFSFNSVEIKNSIFNFWLLYLKYNSSNENIKFCFSTNTKIALREKILTKWSANPELKDNELYTLCYEKIKEILIKEINIRKNKKLQNKITEIQKTEIKSACESFKKHVQNTDIEKFVRNIIWEFNHISPEESIISIRKDIDLLLANLKFNNKPSTLLFSVLLSEIYKKSQNTNKDDRCLTNETISIILKQTDDELKKIINSKLTKLLRIEIELIQNDIQQIQITQGLHSEEIKILKTSFTNFSNKTIPKELTFIPDINSIEVLGWDDFITHINNNLKVKKLVSIFAEGGMGKTSFAKKYLKTFTNYDHIMWINVENSISYAFSFDEVLEINLGIEFIKSDDVNKFKLILNEINKIDGHNLLIVDIQESQIDNTELRLIATITNWEKLILTRSHIKNFTSFKLPRISFEYAKEIFTSNCNKEEINNGLLHEYFEYIDYNVLVIELTAKTIENSFDLTLSTFFNLLKEQKLDDNDFNIDIEVDEENGVIRIFNFLLKKFSFNTLNNEERSYIEYLALLPSSNIFIEDIILINGIAFFDENKITIGNIINSLEKKGLVEYSSDRKRINIHRIIREIIIYNSRKEFNPFFNIIFYIVWLTARIKEGQNQPSNSIRFLKYAESILNSIKEEYRTSVYQPLLMLENELLYSYRYFINTGIGNEHNLRWNNLVSRAQKHLGSDNPNLAVMYNNLALSYANNEDFKNAIIYFKKALIIFKKEESKYIDLVITILNNISNIHLKCKDLVNAMNLFKKVQEIRRKYNYFDGQQLGIEYQILADSYKIAGDYDKAIGLLCEGIKLHKSLNFLKRNDFYLSAYYNQLSHLYLCKNDIGQAITNQEKAIRTLEDINLNKSDYLLQMYTVVLSLYKHEGIKDKEEEVINKINSFKNIQS